MEVVQYGRRFLTITEEGKKRHGLLLFMVPCYLPSIPSSPSVMFVSQLLQCIPMKNEREDKETKNDQPHVKQAGSISAVK